MIKKDMTFLNCYLYAGDYKNIVRAINDNIWFEEETDIPAIWNTKSSKINHIITDPPYETEEDLLPIFRKICDGNILTFCKPENQYFKPDEFLFWIKTPSTKNYTRKCGRFIEMILVSRNWDTFNQLHWSQMTGVYDDRLIYPPKHPYEKPPSLLERLVRIYTNPGDLIFDPFMGSGNIGRAALSLGRRYIGSEIDPEYFELAEERLRKWKL